MGVMEGSGQDRHCCFGGCGFFSEVVSGGGSVRMHNDIRAFYKRRRSIET